MRNKRFGELRLAGTLSIAVAAITLVGVHGEEKHPVYVGSRVCSQCHDGKAAGNQFTLWVLSKHARAFAVLAKPEARDIAKLSGVTQEPHEAPLCLGCHATAAEAEKWERDPTFHLEDGVQCEKCHGPGSEYIDAEVMQNREAAMAAGLKIPVIRDCMMCHNTKGSHVAVHKLAALNIEQAWKDLKHPTPDGYRFVAPGMPFEQEEAPEKPGPKYIGSRACGECHKGAKMGHQYSLWRMSKHAGAFAVLTTPAGLELAAKRGVADPRTSAECLKCHATASGLQPGSYKASFDLQEGVGCEACHGPGSEYAAEAVMLDSAASQKAGLKPVTKATCKGCHQEGQSFHLDKAWETIRHPKSLPQAKETVYKTPLNLALRPDGKELYVACEESGTVVVVDTLARRKTAEITVGGQATDVAFGPDGSRAYVSNRLDDSVSVVDVARRQVVQTFAVGDEPHGILTDPQGGRLYVLNTSADSISIHDTGKGTEIKRLVASRRPWSLALSPDGKRIFITNTLSRFVPFRASAVSEVTVLDAERDIVEDRFLVPEANNVQGIAWHPSGEFGFVTLLRTKNLVPMTRILQGWTISNGLGIVWKDGTVDQVLLDEPGLCFPDPSDVVFTPDGRRAIVTSSGSDRVAVVDVGKLTTMLRQASPSDRARVFPNHQGKPTEFVVKHIATGRSPRGVVVTPDGRTAFVANALDDSLTVIDLASLEALAPIDLEGPSDITVLRRGERLFHSARITFRRQFSCHSCHPDGHINGLTFDIEPDGIGISPVDNRTLRGVLDTAPFKWEGTNPTLARECGPRLSVFFTRIQPFTPDELSALVHYISHIPRPPNRYRPLGAELTPAQRRGREVFFRTRKNSGELIPLENRCSTCHRGPLFTDREVHNIRSKMAYDRVAIFDTPHLNNIYDSAPYLHNGIAETLEEIWTRYNPDDTHGVTNDMTKDQLNDLIEYLKTL
jgi:YVTN family beta-propeller protein